jgi:hypothetical protein
MIDILNLLRITPITEEQIALLLHFSHLLPIIFMTGYSNFIINVLYALYRIMCHESKIKPALKGKISADMHSYSIYRIVNRISDAS